MMVASTAKTTADIDDTLPDNPDLAKAWNTIYNVMQLNRIAFDPEDAQRIIRHPLIVILEALQNDTVRTLHYLTRNEVLLFLAQRAKDKTNSAVICTFFAYFIEAIPVKGLLDSAVQDATTLLLHSIGDGSNNRSVLHALLIKMNKDDAVADAYTLEAVVRGSLEPILHCNDVSFLHLLVQCMDDFEFSDLAVFCKALAVQIVNAVMTDDFSSVKRLEAILEVTRWEQFRVCLVEAIRVNCVAVLAESDPAFLVKLLLLVQQPELVIPICSSLLNHAVKIADFDLVKLIADRSPGSVSISNSKQDAMEAFPIDKQELIEALDRHKEPGQQLYSSYIKQLTKEAFSSIPSLRNDVRRAASQCQILPGSGIEQLLLVAQPVPVCMPASAKVCAYYLAYLQAAELYK